MWQPSSMGLRRGFVALLPATVVCGLLAVVYEMAGRLKSQKLWHFLGCCRGSACDGRRDAEGTCLLEVSREGKVRL